ncbi:MAG: GIY-YIG nuclease family protein [Candidatus Zixiibacteriota bacterium]
MVEEDHIDQPHTFCPGCGARLTARCELCPACGHNVLDWFDRLYPVDAKHPPDSGTAGYIYVLRNPRHSPDLYKIGKTSHPPEERASELSEPTGVPGRFEVVYEELVSDHHSAERRIHEELSEYRVERSEFFQLPLKDALRVVVRICGCYPIDQNSDLSQDTTDGRIDARPRENEPSPQRGLESVCQSCGGRYVVAGKRVDSWTRCPHCGRVQGDGADGGVRWFR